MTRKLFCLTFLLMVLLMSLQLGCSSTPAEVTPTSAEMGSMDTELPAIPTEPAPAPTEVPPTPYPTLSIVWSDDFEDGDYDGWEAGGSIYVNEGALTVGPDMHGDIARRSEVAHGAWSFDVFISDQMMALHRIGIMYDEEIIYGLGILIKTEQNTLISYFQRESGITSVASEFEMEGQISGWNHFDITRDEEGNSIVYLNGEPILEHKDELSITPCWFAFLGPIGSALDNVVVREMEIDSKAPEACP